MDNIANQVRALASGADDATRKNILDALRNLSYSLEVPTDTLNRICYTTMQPALTRVAIDLKLFDILGDSQDSLNVDQLAKKTGAAPVLLGRILRYLSSVGIVEETAKDSFAANNITKSFCIPAIQAGVYHNFDTCAPAVVALPDFLKENGYKDVTTPTHTPMQTAFNTTDPAFIWIQTRPESQAYFNQFMEAHHSAKPRWFNVYPMAEKVHNLDPEQVFFVDVGGGIGHYTVGLKQRWPEIKSRMIIQEMAVVVPTIIPCEGVEGMEHNFFEPQPVKGAKFYFLSNIMHDYPDEKCVAILKNIVSAMGPDSVILINDMVLPNTGVHWHVTQVDLTMMTMLASLERTIEQWQVLMEKAGLKITNIYESKEAVTESVIECVPV
ncbi:S-adenosyl-L-methionine-dependent methyltransferase [Aspergillus karnatakaensis]|uniref:S-adenosyl-L-methionine-dependent methyltransferase n=1 Tax=Aspergillus karnatakaensis TaxID=1810916 RepID=UPI003CCDD2A8